MVTVKKCNGCGEELPHNSFYKGNGKFGLSSRCKICNKAYHRSRAEYKREYYKKNKDKHIASVNRYRVNNLDKLKEAAKVWSRNNRCLKSAYEAKRRAVKLNATLPGYDAEIKEFYKNRPEDHHVDHIVPLQGKTVCGLHVPWNLQYLPEKENLSKSNKLV